MVVEELYSSKRTKGFIIDRKFFLKVYYYLSNATYLKSIKTVIFRSRPENEYFFSQFLLRKGVKTIKVVRFRAKRFLFLLNLDIGYTLSIYEPLSPLDKMVNLGNFKDFLYESVKLSAKLHNLSIRHGDLALSNFAFNGEEVAMIDLETMNFTFSVYQAAKEFADYLHDIWKHVPQVDFLELLELYLFHLNLPIQKKQKLKDFTIRKLKKWGIL